MWTEYQLNRLNFEIGLLDERWGGWHIYQDDNNVIFTNGMSTNRSNQYNVKIVATPNYPLEEPELYVLDSCFASLGTYSHANHTLDSNSHGQRICGYDNWTPEDSVIQAALRLREWLEAYDATQIKGGTISSYLD